MKKADSLKIATYLRTTYQTLKGCAEGRDERYKDFKYIPLNLPFAPTEEQIKGLSEYLLENEDRGLYSKTFGMMDIELLNSIYWKLDQAQWGWDEEVKYNLIIGNKAEVKKLSGEEFKYIVGVYGVWKMLDTILGEVRLLQPIFKNLIPQQEASPTPPPDTSTPINPEGVNMGYPTNRVTDLVTSTENPTGTSPEVWRLPIELDTPEAQGYIKKAVDLGLMGIEPTGYRWLRSLQLLSCFAREMSLKLKLGKGRDNDNPRISWKECERAFNIPKGKLRASYNEIQKTGESPIGIELIDQIFG